MEANTKFESDLDFFIMRYFVKNYLFIIMHLGIKLKTLTMLDSAAPDQ